MGTYYVPRWAEFIRRLDESLTRNTPFDPKTYTQWRVKFDGDWVEAAGENFATVPQGDPCDTAKRLFDKYRNELMPQANAQAGLTAC